MSMYINFYLAVSALSYFLNCFVSFEMVTVSTDHFKLQQHSYHAFGTCADSIY